jgi:hypothetical protein
MGETWQLDRDRVYGGYGNVVQIWDSALELESTCVFDYQDDDVQLWHVRADGQYRATEACPLPYVVVLTAEGQQSVPLPEFVRRFGLRPSWPNPVRDGNDRNDGKDAPG